MTNDLNQYFYEIIHVFLYSISNHRPMTIGILKETQKGEKRVSISPKIAKAFIEKGFDVIVEEDAGKS